MDFDAMTIDELIMWGNRLLDEGQQQRTTAAHKTAHMAAKKVALKATEDNAADTTAEHKVKKADTTAEHKVKKADTTAEHKQQQQQQQQEQARLHSSVKTDGAVVRGAHRTPHAPPFSPARGSAWRCIKTKAKKMAKLVARKKAKAEHKEKKAKQQQQQQQRQLQQQQQQQQQEQARPHSSVNTDGAVVRGAHRTPHAPPCSPARARWRCVKAKKRTKRVARKKVKKTAEQEARRWSSRRPRRRLPRRPPRGRENQEGVDYDGSNNTNIHYY